MNKFFRLSPHLLAELKFRTQVKCAHVCTNISCILAHVDPALAKQVHASGNRVRLADLMGRKASVVVFLRHLG